jgi:hypothetical protein
MAGGGSAWHSKLSSSRYSDCLCAHTAYNTACPTLLKKVEPHHWFTAFLEKLIWRHNTQLLKIFLAYHETLGFTTACPQPERADKESGNVIYRPRAHQGNWQQQSNRVALPVSLVCPRPYTWCLCKQVTSEKQNRYQRKRKRRHRAVDRKIKRACTTTTTRAKPQAVALQSTWRRRISKEVRHGCLTEHVTWLHYFVSQYVHY